MIKGKPLIEAVELDSSYGWTASDVYEKVFQTPPRARDFGVNAARALEIIKIGVPVESEEMDFLSEYLLQDAEMLPPYDPMRDVLLQVRTSLSRLSNPGNT
ncbi:hypothetical protein GCM10027318_01160 [Massilia agilis]